MFHCLDIVGGIVIQHGGRYRSAVFSDQLGTCRVAVPVVSNAIYSGSGQRGAAAAVDGGARHGDVIHIHRHEVGQQVKTARCFERIVGVC